MRKIYFFIVCLLLLVAQEGQGQVPIAGWDFSTQTGSTSPAASNYGTSPLTANTTATGVTVGGLTRGVGIGSGGTSSAAASAWGGFGMTGTSLATAQAANADAYFTITVSTGYVLNLSTIDAYNIRRSNTGPTTGQWAYQIGAGAITPIGSAITWGGTTSSAGNTQLAIDLTGISALQNLAAGTTVTFYVYSWSGAAAGTWYFNSPPPANTANDLVVEGTVTTATCTPVAPTLVSASTDNQQSTINWTNPTCFSDIIIVASPVSGDVGTIPGSFTGVSNSFTGSAVTYGTNGGKIVYEGGAGAAGPQIITGLTNGTTYYFQLFTKGTSSWSSPIEVSATPAAVAAYYFKSNAGTVAKDWSLASTWLFSSSAGGPWSASSVVPSSTASGVTISAGDTVTVTTSINLTKTTVAGTLYQKTGGILNISGSTYDMTILSGGKLLTNSSADYKTTFLFATTSDSIKVNTGGIIQIGIGTTSVVGTNYSSLGGTASTASPALTCNTSWSDGAYFNWNITTAFSSSTATYFPNMAANQIPIFRVMINTGVVGAGGTNNLVINGLFEADGNVTFQNASSKTFRNGIVGNGTVTQSSTSGLFIINGTTAKMGGTNLVLNTTAGGLSNTSPYTTLIANDTISAGPVTITGVFDAGPYITSTQSASSLATYTATGATIRTSNPNGLSGGTNTTFDNVLGGPAIPVNTCTVEYYASVAQNITAYTNYKNLTISGGSTKTLLGNTSSVSGLLKLSSGNILNIAGYILSIDSLSGTGTMSGSATSQLKISTDLTTTPTTLYFTSGSEQLLLLSLKSNSKVTLGTPLSIVSGSSTTPGSLVLTGAATTLNTNNQLTLKSDANGTAQVAPSSGTITGKTIIERYFPSHRSWRLVTAPVNATGAPTINASWQEGYSNLSRTVPQYSATAPSYGTIITKSTTETSNGAGGTVSGYDQGSTNNPSLLYMSGGSWLAPASTNTGAITDYKGYMLFVRGTRNYVVASTATAPTATTLRVTGALNQGTQSISGTGMTVIGNPYASSFYYDGVSSRGTNIPIYYYIWDPLMTGSNSVGAFVTMHYTSAHTYTAVPDPTTAPLSSGVVNLTSHPLDLTGTIQSGEAIIAYFNDGTNSAAGSSTIVETDKTTGNNTYVFRPAAPASEDSLQAFRTNLYALNNDTSFSLEDGVLDLYNKAYSNSVNYLEDAPKLGNILETISLLRNGHRLSIESRQPIVATDTVYYTVAGLQKKNYILEFVPTGLNSTGLAGFLIDSFLNTRTPVQLNATTQIPFTVTSDKASSSANRFTLIFSPIEAATPLPVTFTSVTATPLTAANIAVQWKVENQVNIGQYQVEKSTDGSSFKQTATVSANSLSSTSYNWMDENAVQGVNYYRITSIGKDGTRQYSSIVKVQLGEDGPASIVVYPNPVSGNKIGLKFTTMPSGTYQASLYSSVGQLLLNSSFNYTGSGLQQLSIPNSIAKGVYQLKIVTPDLSTKVLEVEIN